MGYGGSEEIRTLDFLNANQVLSQLSYRPVVAFFMGIIFMVPVNTALKRIHIFIKNINMK